MSRCLVFAVCLLAMGAVSGAAVGQRAGCAVVYRDLSAGVLWSVSPDGGSRQRLAWQPGHSSSPGPSFSGIAWSPDGRRAAVTYENNSKGQPSSLEIVDRTGKVLRRIRLPYDSWWPSWSPDGTRIAFSTGLIDYGKGDVWIVNAVGGGLKDVTRGRGVSRLAAWAPDGRALLISRATSPTSAHSLWIIGVADGRAAKVPIALRDLDAEVADWSPDGRTIVFAQDDTLSSVSVSGIFSVDVNGTRLHRLTTEFGDWAPEWSPNGAYIAFERSGGDPPTDVWVMNPDGSKQRQLTKSDTSSHWNLGKSLEGWRCPPS